MNKNGQKKKTDHIKLWKKTEDEHQGVTNQFKKDFLKKKKKIGLQRYPFEISNKRLKF